MKILLAACNAKYIHSNLAVYSLRAYAKDYQDQIVIGEYTINNRVDYILEQIYKAKTGCAVHFPAISGIWIMWRS